MNTEPVIRANGIVKAYGRIQAVRGITLHVRQGELFGIVGSSGSGKSTLLELLMGMQLADEGDIQVLGMDTRSQSEQLKHYIGFQLQSTALYDRIKVGEAIKLFRSYYNKKRDLDDIIGMLCLKPYLNHYVSQLPESWQQRTALAVALVNDPDILYLDEPFAKLEPSTRAELWSLLGSLCNEGKTIVISTPWMDEAKRYCDRIAWIEEGELSACGTPQELERRKPVGLGLGPKEGKFSPLSILREKGASA